MSTFSTILCAVNLTENAEDIAFYTSELAKANNAKIVLFHTLPRVDNLFELAKVQGGEAVVLEKAEKDAKIFLNKISADYFEGLEVSQALSGKNIADDILELVEEHCADLVVLGSYASKGFINLFNTDNSKNVIGKTRVPVLVVPNGLSLECTPNF